MPLHTVPGAPGARGRGAGGGSRIRYALARGGLLPDDDSRLRELDWALREFDRVAICGAANTGKTLLARRVVDRPVIETDAWKDYSVGDQPDHVIAACAEHDRFVVEGTLVALALRRGLQADVLLWLVKPWVAQLPGQVSQGKGLVTIFESIRETLAIPVVVIP